MGVRVGQHGNMSHHWQGTTTVSRGLSGDSHQDGGQLKVQRLQDIITSELTLVRGCWGVC